MKALTDRQSAYSKAARKARLRYSTDQDAGFARTGSSPRFRYLDSRGRRLSGAKHINRIRSLAIPPAWTEVWICRDPRGHLQATGRDSRGRKQYLYHADWHAHLGESKYDSLREFGEMLPALRRRLKADLKLRGCVRNKVLAAIISLLDSTPLRIGNDEYAKSNRSFGLSTLRDRHVKIQGARIHMRFLGKSGVLHDLDLHDPKLARIVKACQDLPGQSLFQYVDDGGCRRRVGSADVNDYLRTATGYEFTAKMFRTWAGSVKAAEVLAEAAEARTAAETSLSLKKAEAAVSALLRNTPAVCRKSYIHPRIAELFRNGSLKRAIGRRRSCRGLSKPETAFLGLLGFRN